MPGINKAIWEQRINDSSNKGQEEGTTNLGFGQFTGKRDKLGLPRKEGRQGVSHSFLQTFGEVRVGLCQTGSLLHSCSLRLQKAVAHPLPSCETGVWYDMAEHGRNLSLSR